MVRRLANAFLLLVLSGMAVPLHAEAPADRLVLITKYDVDIADEAAFADYMRQRVEAGKRAGLAPANGWRTLRTDNTWLTVQYLPLAANIAAHPDVLTSLVAGTSGEAVLSAANQRLASVDVAVERSLLIAPASLRHEPPDPAPGNFAFVQEFRVAPGTDNAREEFVSFLREINLPYRYEAFRPMLGRGVVVGIVWPDDMVRYYAEFSPAVFMQRYAERFRPLSQRIRSRSRDQETRLYSVQHEYSYPAAPASATAQPAARALAIQPHEGQRLTFCNSPELSVAIKVPAAESGSRRFAMGTGELAARSSNNGRHGSADEIIYFTRGTGSARLGEQTVPVQPGTSLFVPQGLQHAFTNSSDMPMEFVWVVAPAGFEEGLRRGGVAPGTKCPPPAPTQPRQ